MSKRIYIHLRLRDNAPEGFADEEIEIGPFEWVEVEGSTLIADDSDNELVHYRSDINAWEYGEKLYTHYCVYERDPSQGHHPKHRADYGIGAEMYEVYNDHGSSHIRLPDAPLCSILTDVGIRARDRRDSLLRCFRIRDYLGGPGKVARLEFSHSYSILDGKVRLLFSPTVPQAHWKSA